MEKCKNPSCENEVKTKSGKYCSRSCSASHRFTGNTFNKGNVHSDDTKLKISKSNTGSIRSDETRKKMSESASGKTHSIERIEKHSNRMLGNKYSVGNHNFLGKTHTEEFKKELSLRMQGNSFAKGSIRSEETRKKMSDSASNREFTGSSLCNYHDVAGIKCQGASEKKYIENLIENNSILPNKCTKFINTPYGKRLLDFEFIDRFIEIKSTWTLRFYEQSDQQLKDKWITENIKIVELIIID